MSASTGYHGSFEEITSIKGSGTFGGLFGSDERAARSHGDVLHVIESPLHLTDYALNYEIDGAYDVALGIADGDEALADAIMDADCPVAGDVEPEDFAEASWNIQRLRGKLAARLGFTSVEMRDEHGTVTLYLPGCSVSIVQ
jgi:hypothetical protein